MSLALPADLERAAAPDSGRFGILRQLLFGTPGSTIATGALALLAIAVTIGPLAWGKNPTTLNILNALQAPSWAHPMGTDENGRDVFARFLAGGWLSLIAALLVAVSAALVGGLLGVIAGFVGGIVDAVIGRFMDAILAFPALLLAVAVTVGLGAGVWTAALGILLGAIPWYALLLRSDTLRVRNRAYIEAARALGARRALLVRRHIIPHVMPTLLVQFAAVFGYAVLMLAGLGFIGLGAQPPTAEWGSMIAEGLQYTLTGQWWIGVFPGLGVFIAACATAVLADQMAKVLDPRRTEG